MKMAADGIMQGGAQPLELSHSWPMFEADGHFDLGQITGSHILGMDPAPGGLSIAWLADNPDLARQGIGWWECDLADNSLSWTAAVYDLFGLPRGSSPSRTETVALYAEESRAKMERLRAHAIRHRRGFTLDAEVRPASGAGANRMRLIAAPVCDEAGRVVRLRGMKLFL